MHGQEPCGGDKVSHGRNSVRRITQGYMGSFVNGYYKVIGCIEVSKMAHAGRSVLGGNGAVEDDGKKQRCARNGVKETC